MTKYKPSLESKLDEKAVKSPLIEEHNMMGARFRDGEITSTEWAAFQKEWRKRFQNAMYSVVKNRIYIEDINEQ